MANQKGRKHKEAKKGYYERYKGIAEKNRKLRQARHAKKHPNDQQGVGSTGNRRTKPENVSGWLTTSMDNTLTPSQVTSVKEKDTKRLVIPECAQHLRDMKKAERKTFAQIYARIRRLHKQSKPKA